MKFFGGRNREYRVLAIAVLLFGTSLIFFWADQHLPGASSSVPSAQKGPSFQPTQSPQGGALEADFAKFPPPSQFSTFIYSASGINGSTTLSISTTCHDAYITVLIFPASVDYRSGVNTAIYNQAFPCDLNKTDTIVINKSDIASAAFGTYYFIVADQGTSATWYNPR